MTKRKQFMALGIVSTLSSFIAAVLTDKLQAGSAITAWLVAHEICSGLASVAGFVGWFFCIIDDIE